MGNRRSTMSTVQVQSCAMDGCNNARLKRKENMLALGIPNLGEQTLYCKDHICNNLCCIAMKRKGGLCRDNEVCPLLRLSAIILENLD